MQSQKTSNSQSKPEKENKAGDIILPDFKLHHKAMVIQTV